MKALVLLVLVGCLDSSANDCPAGLVCPDDQVCWHVTDPDAELCVDQDQLDACVGKGEYAHCGASSRCYDHACLRVACGNGRTDRADPNEPGDTGEVCDDGNEASGDGCSSDCRSDETCGNGMIDAGRETCDNGNLLSHDGCDSVCEREIERWSALASSTNQLSGQAAVFDLARDRIVMFGGVFNHEPSDDLWEGTAGGLSRLDADTRPIARTGAAMAYDVAHRTTLVFGGDPVRTSVLGDTWLWNGASWSPYSGESPASRSDASIAYDLKRKTAVMFGGRIAGDISGDGFDTWEWNGVWSRIVPMTFPPGRSGAAMAYDAKRDKIVMFGGDSADRAVWEYDPMVPDWHQIQPVGPKPVPRSGAAMTFDPTTGKLLLVGGLAAPGDSTPIRDAWTWDGTVWSPATPPTPDVGAGVVAVTDARRGRVVMVGTSGANLFGLWTWDGVAWSWEQQGSAAPDLMSACTLDPLRGREVALTADGIIEMDGSRWSDPTRNLVGELSFSALAFDPAHRVSVFFGGSLDGVIVDDTWTWDGIAWAELAPATRPPPRARAGMVYDAKTSRVMLFGGTSCVSAACDVLDDTWEWDGTTWQLANPVHRPPARARAAFGYDPVRQSIVMFSGSLSLADTWVWDGADWIQQMATGPSARTDATLSWDASRQRLVLYGGTSATTYANYDVWEWTGSAWEQRDVASSPTRTLHVAAQALEGAGIFTAGGYDGPGTPAPTNEVLRWDGTSPREACRSNIDGDSDGSAGCDDPDCWWACRPLCPPGAPCDPQAPHCGDMICDPLEDGWICPTDCTRPVICGDGFCDPGEDCASDC